jgi:tRNA threonylcarbamoyladenosine biosynthesis protein TsaE
MNRKIEKVCNLGELEELAIEIGSRLKGGEIIELRGDLGSGKTTFVSSLVKGTGCKEKVSSPTFVIKKLYKTKEFDIHHFDFYRLQSKDQILYELREIVNDKNSVIIIEWPDILDDILPPNKVKIKFIYDEDLNKRIINIDYPEELKYLFKP